jgi:hypothetical protein
LDKAATRVVKFALLVATPAIVGSEEPPVPDEAAGGVIGEGAAGDSESLQPTTVTEMTSADRKPMLFFMTLSLVSFAPWVLNHAAPRCIRLRMFCRRRLRGHFLNTY